MTIRPIRPADHVSDVEEGCEFVNVPAQMHRLKERKRGVAHGVYDVVPGKWREW
jgi:hypothetical protein